MPARWRSDSGWVSIFSPILTAPPSPDAATLESTSKDAVYSAELAQDLRGHDFLHWGRGTISLTQTQIVHEGELVLGAGLHGLSCARVRRA